MEFNKRKPKIFIISGKAGNGKDTASNMIKEYYEEKDKKVINLRFSSYLKEYAKKISGWDGSEETKPRTLLQNLGIELIRNKIDANMLIRRICEDIEVYSYFFDIIIVSDARLKSEIETLREMFENVVTIRINRTDYDNNLTSKEKNHITETELDDYNGFDYIIDNKGESLKEKIEKVLEELK